MNGREVLRFVVLVIFDGVNEVVKNINILLDEVKYIVFY